MSLKRGSIAGMTSPAGAASSIQVPGLDPEKAPDAIMQDAVARALPIRIKIQPDLYRYESPSAKGMYLPWRGISWKIDAGTVDEAEQVRAAYEALHEAIAAGKLAQAIAGLLTVVGGTE